MTFPTVIETPLRLEPVTRDPFGDVPPSLAPASTSALTPQGPARLLQSA